MYAIEYTATKGPWARWRTLAATPDYTEAIRLAAVLTERARSRGWDDVFRITSVTTTPPYHPVGRPTPLPESHE